MRIHATLVYRKASIFKSMGLEGEGGNFYKDAMNVDSSFSMLHFNLGLLYEKQEKFELAKQQFERALKVNPDYEKAKSGLERVEKRWKSKLDN
jgi:tetratricopeptide (TPR) repeat protein|tara:strand:+ start:126 stop:404 length:279 start_codon:yes stop_codon:yes gene_type:complete